MKKLFLILSFSLSLTILFAQTPPEKINYQAVARDLAGNPLANQNLTVIFDIRQGSSSGTSVYTETHSNISTNQFGLFTAEIGEGAPSLGTLAGINWGTSLHYLAVFVNGDLMGSTQLLSVPYALYAKQAANGPQGLPGKNSLSLISPEPQGANCPFGGTKVQVGLDDNANNTLDLLEIDDTYFVCNGDTTSSGQGFWSIANGNIYNNNTLGNVGIGTSFAPHKLTAFSTDTIIASFSGSNTGGAAILVSNINPTGATGIVFANNQDSSALLGLDPTSKFLTLLNGIQGGDILISTDRNIILKSRLILNDADTVVFAKGITNNVYTTNKGLFDTDSLRVGGVNASNTNYVLTNNGNGNATWKDPNTLISGGASPWTEDILTNNLFPTNLTRNVGIGTITPEQKLDIIGSLRIGAGSTNSNMGLLLSTPNPGLSLIRAGGRATTEFRIEQPNNASLTFFTNTIERVRIDGSGKVGVGVNNPTAKLDLFYSETAPPTTNNAVKIINGNTLGIFRRGIDVTVNTANNSGQNIGLLTTAGGSTGTGTNYALQAYTIGTTGTNFAGYFGSGINGTGRVYIQDELGIGITPGAGVRLDVNGNFKLGTQGNVNSKYITGNDSISVTSTLNTGVSVTITITVTNAVIGDFIVATLNNSPPGIFVASASVTAANQVAVTLLNASGTFVAPSSFNISYIVFK